jgi:hypothetical protein
VTHAARSAALALLLTLPAGLAAAANPFESLRAGDSAEAAPAVVSRELATADLARTQRLAIAALQDLGFALESADAERGTLVASRLDAYPLRLAITLAPATDTTLTATVLADYAGRPLADPRPAEAFLAALAASLSPPPPID